MVLDSFGFYVVLYLGSLGCIHGFSSAQRIYPFLNLVRQGEGCRYKEIRVVIYGIFAQHVVQAILGQATPFHSYWQKILVIKQRSCRSLVNLWIAWHISVPCIPLLEAYT